MKHHHNENPCSIQDFSAARRWSYPPAFYAPVDYFAKYPKAQFWVTFRRMSTRSPACLVFCFCNNIGSFAVPLDVIALWSVGMRGTSVRRLRRLAHLVYATLRDEDALPARRTRTYA